MREWLPEGHPVHLVIAAVEGPLDTSAFHARRRTGGAGAAGFDPDMLVTLLLWAYAQGVTSSRRIEAACWSDVAFRVICAGDAPDHVTIARFRAALPGAVEALFSEVLVLCARLGMGKLGTVALDGTKIAASASGSANRGEEALRKLAAGLAAEHAANDAAEDELYGPGARGDEVPAEVADPRTRAGRIAAALAGLEAERQAAEAAARDKAGVPGGGRGRASARERPVGRGGRGGQRPAGARAGGAAGEDRCLAPRRQAEQAAGGPRRPGGRPPAVPCAGPFPVRRAAAALAKAEARAAETARKAARRTNQPARNITDPDSRLMPVRGGGFVQGYNAQNVTSSDKLIIATRLTNDPNDNLWYEPMIAAAAAAAALITANQPAAAGDTAGAGDAGLDGSGIGLVLADCGYLSGHNLTTPGPDRLIATGRRRKLEKAARKAAGGAADGKDKQGPIAPMTARLATEEGITAYRQRGHIAETPHGHIKHNMGFRQLSMRGKTRAAAEWQFTAATCNLFKAITTGHLTTAALAALAR